MRKLHITLTLAAACLFSTTGKAQLSSNPDKFLGNITTSGSVDYGNEPFYTLWNQITPENETKWSSIEGSARGSFNFGRADNAANYAKKHKFPFKFHTLVWGSQYPGWIKKLSVDERYKAIVEWFDAVKKHYPNLEIIDVANEAVDGHQEDTHYMKEALGGGGKTGYDWLIKAFEMAHERWPNAILVYNDFNTFQWNTDQFIDLVRTLRDAGAPIDAYGCQSHDMLNLEGNDVAPTFKSSMDKMHQDLMLPMYSTEYDVGTYDDDLQLKAYKEQIPYMWESDYCAGITLWGYIYGKTWTTKGNSGIIKDGKDRLAMEWLREYMQSDAAKNAKSPFPGMKKPSSIYIRPIARNVAKNDQLPIYIRANLADKEIEKVEVYVSNALEATLTEAPYVVNYTAKTTGTKTVKAVVTATDGTKYERLARFTVLTGTRARAPYKSELPELPGTVEAEDFDAGLDGVSFHDSNTSNQGVRTYRTDGAGVDIIKVGDDGYGIGYTQDNEWLEYTVDVKEEGLYSLDIDIAASAEGGRFHLVENTMSDMNFISGFVEVPNTGGSKVYKTLHVRMPQPLKVGRQVITLCIDKGGFNIDKLAFTRLEEDNNMKVTVKSAQTKVSVDEPATITVTASSTTSNIASVKVLANNMLVETLTEAPYTVDFYPNVKGTYTITAIAIDDEGRESQIAKTSLKVNGKREPYKTLVSLPGIIQAENFDKGGEGFTFHDTNTTAEGDGKTYRTDAEGVDIIKCTNGYALGYTAFGEWTEYSVNVKEPGTYSYEATVSSTVATSSFRISLVNANGVANTLTTVRIPKTGDTYKVVEGDLSRDLPEGQQIIRFTITGANCNIDKVKFNCLVNTYIDDIATEPTPSADDNNIYNISGQKVDANYKGIVIKNGKKVWKR